MTDTSVIDLSRLPAPTLIEPLSFEQILDELRTDLLARDPELADVLALESDPLVKLLEVVAYREMIMRQRHNDRVRRLLLAYASGADLDHIGVSYFFTARHVLEPGDPGATPPQPPTLESDDDYRRRLLLAPDRFSTAGAEGAYIYHALGADPEVRDATATSPAATEVTVAVLARQGDGTADQPLLDRVADALNANEIRPLTDLVTVVSAEVVNYQVRAALTLRPGPDPEPVRQAAIDAVAALVERRHRLGADLIRDAILAALYVEGVERVELLEPAADLPRSPAQAAYCTAVEVTIDG